MSKETQGPPIEAELDTYSTAALLALQSRLGFGNDTTYDRFLCAYIGDPAYGSPNFRPIERRAPSGTVYGYNNPLNMRRSYSVDGSMVNVRWAQDFDPSADDERASLFVATADLRADTVTEWQVTDVERAGFDSMRRIVTLESPAYSGLTLVGEAPCDDADPLARILARRQHIPGLVAQLVLDTQGDLFLPPTGPDERLSEATLLVAEVNDLTARYSIDLEARRHAASERLAQVIPIRQLAA
jgi:hypothetical protein